MKKEPDAGLEEDPRLVLPILCFSPGKNHQMSDKAQEPGELAINRNPIFGFYSALAMALFREPVKNVSNRSDEDIVNVLVQNKMLEDLAFYPTFIAVCNDFGIVWSRVDYVFAICVMKVAIFELSTGQGKRN
ncbi:hypothetical protein RF11_10645 [Thelohanellus kitauei]|uniref:Uncharacterized protein n=1 Tax=Thelohanellus kitauei TaxID=669202 RepID=A0A0C2JRM4_THEKT|nr:hypothetical protein RF11_10645 [Thelohanellus kitauei]